MAEAAPAADERPWTVERLFADLRSVLGEHYRVTADGCFAWLTPFCEEDHERVATVARHGVRRLGELLPGLRVAPPPGGWPAVLFATLDAHLAYNGFFGGGAEQRIISGGSYRAHPLGHLAIPVSSQDSLDAAFAHELTHAMLSPRGMPTWLQEGIACEVEARLGNRADPFSDRRELDECMAFWRSHEAKGLWSGKAFVHPDSSRHAYRLAQILVARWTRDAPAMAALCALGPDDWRGRATVLGVDRERLFASVVWPSRQRGWLERALYFIFVGDDAR